VEVTNSNSKSVSSIFGSRNFSKMEKLSYHHLDLLFLGATIAYHGRLDGQGGIFCNMNLMGGGGQHGDSADLPQLDSRFCVERIKNVFDGNAIRMVVANQTAQMVEYDRELSRERITGRQSYTAEDDRIQSLAVIEFDHAVARTLSSAINSQNSHPTKSLLEKEGHAD
jgi:hypothetical protein